MTLDQLTVKDFDELVRTYGSGTKAARAINVARSTFQDAYARARKTLFGSRDNVKYRIIEETNKPQYFILSSAQDGTVPDAAFLTNLQAYAEYIDAEIMISGFSYNKSLFETHNKDKVGYHSDIEPYMTSERVMIGSQLLFCGEMNTLPTAVTPLSGFHNYTGEMSGIFPHPKVQLESVPTLGTEKSKVLMTTGCVTKPNYVPKKAGIKAEYHHIIGAVIVELRTDGRFFSRHLIAAEDGSFFDLDRFVGNGEVTTRNRVEAITWGDIHTNKLNENICYGAWGYQFVTNFFGDEGEKEFMHEDYVSLCGRLGPSYQFFHDVLDFEVRNHHNIHDHIFRYKQHINEETVEHEILRVRDFLRETSFDGCQSVVVESNHDLAFGRWLKTADYRHDPANAKFFLECQLKLYENINDDDYSIFIDVMVDNLQGYENSITFLSQDKSFKICEWSYGGIECALHGHNGLNGARPNYKSFTKIGTRCNLGHSHSPAIYEGVYQAGITCNKRLGYNVGPSSWDWAHIVTYDNAKRAIVFMDECGEYTTLPF